MYLSRSQAVRVVKPLMTYHNFDGIVKKFNIKPLKMGHNSIFTKEQIFKIMIAYYLYRKVGHTDFLVKYALEEISNQNDNFNQIIVKCYGMDDSLKEKILSAIDDDEGEKKRRRYLKSDDGHYSLIIIDAKEINEIQSIFLKNLERCEMFNLQKISKDLNKIFEKGIKNEDPLLIESL